MDNSGITMYEGYPNISDLFQNGGVPGVTYAFIASANLAKAVQEGWATTHRTHPFIITGPRGEASCVVVAKGKPINGANRAGTPVVLVDSEIEKLTGNKIDGEEEKTEAAAQA